MKRFLPSLIISLLVLPPLWITAATFERDAYQTAIPVIDEPYRSHVLSIYGKGTPSNITTWYFNFFDPTTKTKGKVVVLENGKISRVHPSEEGSYSDDRSFDPTLVKITFDSAVKVAAGYAQDNQVPYDSINALLRRPGPGEAPSWRIELRQGTRSKGFVYVNGIDGAFVKYEAEAPAPKIAKSKTKHDDGSPDNVKDTFLHIGGELEQFFTGERTVDR
jgi:hypothetical protein